MAGIYIHIPFCKQACHYCDFHFSTNQSHRKEMCMAIAKELALQADYLTSESISTLYWGGGTPSLLSESEFGIILESVHKHFSVEPNIEQTLEANPDDLTQKKLALIKSLGFNRLSIGIQSFDDEVLRFFNRAHSADEALKCMELSRGAGFANISIDLIYAVPSQSQDDWKKNIESALALRPEHISAYSLTIEEKTVFGNWNRKGKLQPADENEAALNFITLMDMLEMNGYEHYEISNFCKPGFYSRHNSSYWKQARYLGVGPSAHSYNGVSRQSNLSNNSLYQKSIESGTIPAEIEILTRENKINEYIFTTLRTIWGCDLSFLKENFAYDLASMGLLQKMKDQEWVIQEGNTLYLTRKGKLLADQIASDLFIYD
ncbi:MAG: radical SAM family heme chaperone HemW [Bacteroidetes bacterium]|nr:radical SAM family heme chaperone HemW [Bacteroidota bacterium]